MHAPRKMGLGRLGSKMGLSRGSKMGLGRLDTRQNGSESENTRHFGCEAELGTLVLGRTRHFSWCALGYEIRQDVPSFVRTWTSSC